ncbi:YdcH family protein [Oceanicella actignis]|uniref:DUF465 domain-containing protein n=1 Tax=Oceanicella actignis TaxID=1189325 RepID=A0A1M7TJ86_9RHOB|nr:DUF465 domain-containing protein [Oceanicella actignis]TYO88150.1 hypothetical protein LY05_02298 [Oceanicella actignis]SET66020.1 hypothetical protein SAMN04488119_10723 [Oceanicella actignis]SHN70780.1 hypothetical protein SAMN05216200_10722 [Oceanicella actignis]
MSLDAHLAQLRKKHEALSRLIEAEQRSPAADDLEIGKLKKQKLRIKEEIERLSPTRH